MSVLGIHVPWFCLAVYAIIFGNIGIDSFAQGCQGGLTNDFRGHVLDLVQENPTVTSIDCRRRSLSGQLPSELGQLTQLTYLDLSFNDFSGSIPTEVANLESLLDLRLAENELTSSIPKQLGKLMSMEILFLDGNKFSTSIPKQLGNLRNLSKLGLTQNNLIRSIPTEFGKLTRLIELWLTTNQLTGSIPTQLGNLINIRQLSLKSNKLNFSIPEQLGNLTSLNALYLSSNELSKSIPSQLEKLSTNILRLELDNNKLTQSIPTVLGSLTNLGKLWLGNNKLNDSIPTEIGKLTSLDGLELQDNELSGSIPKQLGKLAKLERLELQNNEFIINQDIVSLYENWNKKSPDLRLSNNILDTTCDSTFLKWYPDFSVNIKDRELISCSEDRNIYGELGLNPHVLRVDIDAPKTHVTWKRDDVMKTSRNIHLRWSYNDSEEATCFEYSREIGRPNKRCLPFNISNYDYRSNNATEQIALFRKCQPFLKPEYKWWPTKRFFGFEIGWGMERLCILASEAASANSSDFGYDITTLIPAKEYKIHIRPFYFNFTKNEYLTDNIVFGIQSTTLIVQTEEEKPAAGPDNITLVRRTDSSITLNWTAVPETASNGKIIGYVVICDGCPQRRHETTVRQIEFNALLSETVYIFSVNAVTSAGEGPFSIYKTIKTCLSHTWSKAEETRDCENAAQGYFLDGGLAHLVMDCSTLTDQIDVHQCLAVNSARDLVLNEGYWRPNINSAVNPQDSQRIVIELCPEPRFCNSRQALVNFTGNMKMESNIYCAQHHSGVFCSGCINDDYKVSSSGCVKCETEDVENHTEKFIAYTAVAVLLIILYLVKIFVVALYAKNALSSNKRKRKTMRIWKTPFIFKEHLATKIKIWLVTSQILLSLQNSFSTKSPEGDTKRNSLLLIISLELESFYKQTEVHCYSEVNFYKKLLFVTLGPTCLILLFWIICFVTRKLSTSEKIRDAVYGEVFVFTLLVMFFVYAPASETVIDTFLCKTIYFDSQYERFLREDYRLSCDDDKHQSYEVFAGFMLITLYPVGILLTYTLVLYQRRKYFFDANKSTGNSHELKLVRFLTRPYCNNAYWFEVYELLRKLSMTSLVAVVAAHEDEIQNTFAAETFALIVGIASLIFIMYVRPYKYNDDFLFSVISLFILCFCTQISALAELSGGNESVRIRSEYEAIIYTVLAWLEFSLLLLFMTASIFFVKSRCCLDGTSKTKKEMLNEQPGPKFETMLSMSACSEYAISGMDMAKIYEDEAKTMVTKLKEELANTKRQLKQNTEKLKAEFEKALHEKDKEVANVKAELELMQRERCDFRTPGEDELKMVN